MTQWEYRLEVNLGRPFPKRGRIARWLHETEPTDPESRKYFREHPVENKTLSESLDELGRDGWELVSVVPTSTIWGTESILYYFKRDRNEDRPFLR